MAGTWTIEAGRTSVSAATSFLSGLGQGAVSVGNTDLGPFFRQLDDLSRQVEAGRVALLGQALSRAWSPSRTVPAPPRG
jgi:hypothetical protein